MRIDYTSVTDQFFLSFPWRNRLLGLYKEPVLPHDVRDYIKANFGEDCIYRADTNTWYFPAANYELVHKLRNRYRIETSNEAHRALSLMMKAKSTKGTGAYVDCNTSNFLLYPGMQHGVSTEILNYSFLMPVRSELITEELPAGPVQISRYKVPITFAREVKQLIDVLSLPYTPAAEAAFKRLAQHQDKQATGAPLAEAKMLFEPMPHQQIALNKIAIEHPNLRYPHGRILADEPGMGKTYIALAALLQHGKHSSLIAVPAALKRQWIDEAKKFAGIDLKILTSKDALYYASQGEMPQGYYIVSHNLLPNVVDLALNFGAFVVDEAHMLKNEDGVWHNSFLELADSSLARMVLLITGTPIYNNPDDLVGMLKLLKAEHLLQSHDRLSSGLYVSGNDNTALYRQAAGGDLNIPESLYQTVLIRRKREDVGAGLQAMKERRKVHLDMVHSANLKRAYERLKNHKVAMDAQVRPGIKRPVDPILERITAYRRDLSVEKAKASIPYIKKMLGLGRRILVFTDFLPAAKYISNVLGCPAYTGERKEAERQRIMVQCEAKQVPVMVLTLQTASAGLNLQMFNHVIFVDIPWTHSQREQGEARAYRSGQQHDVFVDYLLAGTFDEVTYEQGEAQHEVNELVLQEKTFDALP